MEELKKTLFPPNSEGDLESHLLHLRQGNQSVCHSVSAHWLLNKILETLPFTLYLSFGLANYIRGKMVGHVAFKTLEVNIDLALKIDQRVLLRPRADTHCSKSFCTLRSSPTPSLAFAPGGASNDSADHSTEEPMQLGRLSKEERELHWHEGLCA